MLIRQFIISRDVGDDGGGDVDVDVVGRPGGKDHSHHSHHSLPLSLSL